MLKYCAVLAVLLCFASTASAFWTGCLGARPPDRIESPMCQGDRCFAVRGEVMQASVFISSPISHHELMVRSFVFLLGVGIELPAIPPYDNGCNSLFIGGVQQHCPTQPNRQYEWRVYQEIPMNIPAFQNSRVQFQLWDRGVLEGCAEVIATVV